jgi:hypothetical protein
MDMSQITDALFGYLWWWTQKFSLTPYPDGRPAVYPSAPTFFFRSQETWLHARHSIMPNLSIGMIWGLVSRFRGTSCKLSVRCNDISIRAPARLGECIIPLQLSQGCVCRRKTRHVTTIGLIWTQLTQGGAFYLLLVTCVFNYSLEMT